MSKLQGWIIIGLLAFICIHLCILRNTMYEIKTLVGDIETHITYTEYYVQDIKSNLSNHTKIFKDINSNLILK